MELNLEELSNYRIPNGLFCFFVLVWLFRRLRALVALLGSFWTPLVRYVSRVLAALSLAAQQQAGLLDNDL